MEENERGLVRYGISSSAYDRVVSIACKIVRLTFGWKQSARTWLQKSMRSEAIDLRSPSKPKVQIIYLQMPEAQLIALN
jgi:hypothetical protein